MDVLNRILELKIERSWTQYRLSVRSGIPTSDISVWYGRQSTPNPVTLEKVCKGFDITMAEFFIENEENAVTLTPKQFELMESMLRLTTEQREYLIEFLQTYFKEEEDGVVGDVSKDIAEDMPDEIVSDAAISDEAVSDEAVSDAAGAD